MIGVNVSKELRDSEINQIQEEARRELLEEIYQATIVFRYPEISTEPNATKDAIDRIIKAVRVYDFKTTWR